MNDLPPISHRGLLVVDDMLNSNQEPNRRVLIIDDNRSIHEDFRKILCPVNPTATALAASESALFGPSPAPLAQRQFELDSAYQGQDGLMMVKNALDQKRPYAMAFVDIRMPPGWDGVETTRNIWAVDPEIQIVICTAYADYSWDEMFEQIGHCDGLVILKKPFDTVEALQLAHALTEKWRLHKQSQRKMEELESLVAERVSELQQANLALKIEAAERKRFEAKLLHSQKMETVGKLAGGIAHEFNSILTVIIGQSELLLGDLSPGSPLARNATEISRAAGRAATLTRQLLAFGRKQILQPENINLNRVLANMQGMFHHLMGGDVDAQIVPGASLQLVRADVGQIEQVIINMAINAREAMPNGGKLILETANVSFDEQCVDRHPELKAGDYVLLTISDTGPGMSEEVKSRLFEPFFSTKEVGQGTGLGLSTCYGIVKQSGGHINVCSEPGCGASFKIYLPQVPPQARIPLQRLDSHDWPRGTETILMVEDDPALREMAGMLLRRLGYTTWSAASGIEAMTLREQRNVGHIDLLFTDVVMPRMSGKELAERVQALNPHTRILFTTAYTENTIIHQGMFSKGVALLQKPFTPSALARKVREVLDQPCFDAAQNTFDLAKLAN